MESPYAGKLRRRRKEMNNLSQLMVLLWFVPVAFFIIIPLGISFVYSALRIFRVLFTRDSFAEEEASISLAGISG